MSDADVTVASPIVSARVRAWTAPPANTGGLLVMFCVAVTLAVAVAVSIPSVPPRPVTVRVKASSVLAARFGIVTSGVALVESSNVTLTPLAGVVSAHR